MHKNWWILIGIAVVAVVASILIINKAGENSPDNAGMPNPASVYCEKQGGNLSIISNKDGSQYGLCIFDDGSSCEEWAFFRGECAKGNAGCSSDEDCVPDSCCHPKSCVSNIEAPVCKGIACTMNCEPATLDCGQGSCNCVNNKCEAVFNE